MNAQDGGLPKCPTGIDGFDTMTGGGLPRDRAALILGGPGTGKTIFGLQTLVHGAQHRREPGIFVAFEEDSSRILANAAGFGWDLPRLEQEHLLFVDARLPTDAILLGDFDLAPLLAGLEAKAREMGARRIVFDAIDALVALLNDPVRERLELTRLYAWTQKTRLTCLVTAKAVGPDPLASTRSGYLPFLLDAVVLLKQRLHRRVALRELRILKYRGSKFAENAVPYCIDEDGIDVAGLPTRREDPPVVFERVSSGVAGLDDMLEGGYFRGASVLISGSPGTAKTTLAGAFADAACRRGETVLIVGFDEASEEMVRNLASVGLPLADHRAAGLLHLASLETDACSGEEHLLRIRKLVRQHRPRALVVDPLSALLRAGDEMAAVGVAQRLLRIAKNAGITLVCTSLLDSSDSHEEGSPIQVSTLADAWIHLSFLVHGGERNRALTIVKARGTGHSHQVRELVLRDRGIGLRDVYTAGGEVLMGTARWEKENAAKVEADSTRRNIDRRRRELEAAATIAQARLEALRLEIEGHRNELALLGDEEAAGGRDEEQRRRDIRHLRGGSSPLEEGTSP